MPEDDLEDLVPGIEIPWWPEIRYNIAPSLDILTVLNGNSPPDHPGTMGADTLLGKGSIYRKPSYQRQG